MKSAFKVFTIVCLAILGSCKKEPLPESKTGNPVFYFKGVVNNELFDIKAGVDNYYLFSSFDQKQDSGGYVYNFFGTLKQTDCDNCPNSIEIQINDYKTSSPGAGTNISKALEPDNLDYFNPIITAYQVQFNSLFINGSAPSYSWNFGDGGISTDANPTHLFTGKGPFNVCLAVSGDSSCTSTICNAINPNDVTPPFYVSLSTQAPADNWIKFIPEITGGKWPFNFYWEFGDGSTSEIDTGLTKKYSTPGLYEVFLRVVDANGDTVSTRVNAPTNTYTSCVSNYKVINIQSIQVQNIGLSNIIINWTDHNGIHFTSNNGQSQPNDSYFQILSEEAYFNNENGQPTRKVYLKFTCTLYSGTQAIQIKDGEAVIAVAYE